MIQSAETLTKEWLSDVLGAPVESFVADASQSARARLLAHLQSGESLRLRLKTCLGETFGRSEVDFYQRDYIGMEDAPLMRCFDAQFEAGVGYHLLLEDLAETHENRFEAPPTLSYGLALAGALGRLHAHHWESKPAPDEAFWSRYFSHISPGVAPLEEATGVKLAARFDALETALRARWADPRGMSLLHGDLNPGNILTPKGADAPVYFLDRQPFDWSVTYGVAAYDLAYACALWQPADLFEAHRGELLRRWHAALKRPDYSLAQAQEDFALSIEHCLHIPIEWCTNPGDVKKMHWVWEPQLDRLRQAIENS